MVAPRGTFTSVSGHGGYVVVFNSSRNAANGVVTPPVYTVAAGNNGAITVGGVAAPYLIAGGVAVLPGNTGPNFVFSGITKWELTKNAVLTEITHSGSMGWQQRKAIVRGGQFTLEFVWDANNCPDSDVTLDAGDEPVVALKRGANAGYYQFAAIVESVKLVDDNQKDVIRGTISGFTNSPIYARLLGPTNGA